MCVYILRDDGAVGAGSEVIYICGASGTKAASTQVQYVQHLYIYRIFLINYNKKFINL